MDHFSNRFAAAYHADVIAAPVRSTKRYCYPGAIENGEVHGIGVEFQPIGLEPWFATFAAGSISPNAVNVALYHPNPSEALVVSRGDGYVVDVSDPTRWSEVPRRPIMGLISIEEMGTIILWDFTKFVAIGADGIRWTTPHLSWDGIREVRREEDHLVGEVWDATKSSWARTSIAISDGSFEGGASPG
ncbi:MAG: hypothetical protein WD845_05510 [Pirellulales bacterium]